jgi:hypothetical protein
MENRNTWWRPIPFVLAMALGGCGSDPTPAGTTVLELDARPDVPAELRKLEGDASDAVQTHSSKQPLIEDEGEVQIDLATARGPDGGQYILEAKVTVHDSAGYTVTAGAPGNPVNRGSEEAPLHTRMISVAAFKSGWGRSTGGTRMFEVRGDGTVQQK